eukprot:1183079-Pleurochrysis_carterae.AAC.3
MAHVRVPCREHLHARRSDEHPVFIPPTGEQAEPSSVALPISRSLRLHPNSRTRHALNKPGSQTSQTSPPPLAAQTNERDGGLRYRRNRPQPIGRRPPFASMRSLLANVQAEGSRGPSRPVTQKLHCLLHVLLQANIV